MDTTKAAFAEAYLKLQIQNPTRRITIKDIAAYAGYDRHTFYYHFNSLLDLFSWIFDNEVGKIISGAGGDWKSIVTEFISVIYSNKAFMLGQYHSHTHQETLIFLSRKMKEVMDYFLDDEPRFSSYTQSEKETISIFITGGTIALLSSWFSSGMEKSADEVSAELMRVIADFFSSRRA